MIVFLLAAAALCAPLARTAHAAPRKMVLILADQITLKELNDPGAFRNFHEAVKRGALGLMITQPPAAQDSAGAYATLGAGRPVRGAHGAGHAFNISETPPFGGTVVSAYITRMAEKPPVDRVDILHLGLPGMQRANGADAGIGALGEALWKHGVTTCVFGNADFDGEPHREAALVAMNARGQVERGDMALAGLRKLDAFAPFQASADPDLFKDFFYENILHTFGDPDAAPCDFMVVELGDTRRAEMFRETADPVAAGARKREALGRLDDFLGFVLGAVDLKGTQVLLVSPSAPLDGAMQDETMTPVLAVGAGVERGLLLSRPARRAGLIRNTDIAPHILDYFGADAPAAMQGAPLAVKPGSGAVAQLLRMQYMDAMRMRVGRVGRAAVTLAFAVVALAFFTALRMPRVVREWLVTQGAALCLAAALFPALLFSAVAFMSLFGDRPGGFLHYVGLIAGFTLVLGLPLALIPKAEWRALCMAGAYAAMIAADALLGFALSRDSVLTPSPQSGQAFAGMAPALAGFLCGAALLGAGVALDLARERAAKARWAAPPALAAAAALMCLPMLGANMAALLPASAAFTLFCVLLFRKRFRWAEVLMSAAIGMALFAGFAGLAALLGGGTPPGARTLAMLKQSGGLHEFARLLFWRAAANLAAFRAGGVWSMLLFATGVCTVMFVFFPNSRAESLFRRFTHTRLALLAALAGAAVAFVFLAGGETPAAAVLFLPAAGALILCVSPMKKTAAKKKSGGEEKPLSLFSKKPAKPADSSRPAAKARALEKPVSSPPAKPAVRPADAPAHEKQDTPPRKKPRRRRPPRNTAPGEQQPDKPKQSGAPPKPDQDRRGKPPGGKKRRPPRNNLPPRNRPRGGPDKPGGGPDDGGGGKDKP